MSKASSTSQQFFTKTGNHSLTFSRRGYDVLRHGEDPLTQLSPVEQRDSLVAAWKNVQARIQEAPKGSEERRVLGILQLELQMKISALRPKLKGGKEVADHFISVAKELLPKHLYKEIMDEASRRARQVSAMEVQQ